MHSGLTIESLQTSVNGFMHLMRLVLNLKSQGGGANLGDSGNT